MIRIDRTEGELIDELPPRRRTLMRMLFINNPYSYDEIARLLEFPVGGLCPTRVVPTPG